jgi:hypothetical protein
VANRARYATREAVKLASAGTIQGAVLNDALDRHIDAITREIDDLVADDASRASFIPITETRYLDGSGDHAWTPFLLSISELKVDEDGDGTYETTLTAADYWLWPDNEDAKRRIDLNPQSTVLTVFPVGRRRIQVIGSWGYSSLSVAAGGVTAGLAASAGATTFEASDSSLIGIGDCLLIGTEQVFVTSKVALDIAQNTSGALTASVTNTALTLGGAPTVAVKAGEVLRIESELVRVNSVNSTTSFEVTRAYDGSTLAAHSGGADVYVYRTITIERGVNGTTAATHPDATAIARYYPPSDVTDLCIAEVIGRLMQEQSGWGREIGTGDGAREYRGSELRHLRERLIGRYRRTKVAI